MSALWPTLQPAPNVDLPPWGWNPTATFLTAYTTAQEEKRAQEEFQMKAALDKILFPAKKAQAEFTLKQLAYESERMANSYKLLNEETDERRRILRSGGSGASSNVAGNGGSSNQAPASGYQSRFGFGSKLTPPAASAPQAAQPTTRKVGSGLMPKNS